MTNIFKNTCLFIFLASMAYLLVMFLFGIIMHFGILGLLGYSSAAIIVWVGTQQLFELQTRRYLAKQEDN